MRKANTIGFFNVARGIGIIYVLFFHSLLKFCNVPYQTPGTNLGEGLMAMFFMVSGYSFYSRESKKCIKTQVNLLLKPYWITAAMVIAAKMLLAVLHRRSFWEFGGQYIFSYLFALNEGWTGTILGLQVDHIALFWFFWALFGAWVIYNGIMRLHCSETIRRVLVLVCMLAGWGLSLVSRVWPFAIPSMLVAVGYLFVGHMMRETDWLERENLSLWEWIGITVPAAVCVLFGGVHMYYNIWELGPLDVLGIGCLGIIYIRFFAWLSRRMSDNFVTRSLESIGFQTLWIFCVHGFEEKVVPWFRLGDLFGEYRLAAALSCFVMRSIIVYCGVKLLTIINKKLKKMKRARKRHRIVIER